jgi:hypothetical protein
MSFNIVCCHRDRLVFEHHLHDERHRHEHHHVLLDRR